MNFERQIARDIYLRRVGLGLLTRPARPNASAQNQSQDQTSLAGVVTAPERSTGIP